MKKCGQMSESKKAKSEAHKKTKNSCYKTLYIYIDVDPASNTCVFFTDYQFFHHTIAKLSLKSSLHKSYSMKKVIPYPLRQKYVSKNYFWYLRFISLKFYFDKEIP